MYCDGDEDVLIMKGCLRGVGVEGKILLVIELLDNCFIFFFFLIW